MAATLETVLPEDGLYRRLTAFAVQGGRVTSAAYKQRGKPDPEPSVDLARLTTPAQCLICGGRPELGIGELPARIPFALHLSVVHTPEPNNNAHCVIKGEHTKETCRRLAEATTILKSPAGAH